MARGRSSRGERNKLNKLLRAVVRVSTISDAPDYEQPWQTQGPESSTGSGVVVRTRSGMRVLTNAHCVENAVFVELRRYGKSKKFTAEVEAVGSDCDLAILMVDDVTFFDGVEPLPIGQLPGLSDRVQVYGYPIGGERLSITQGIVSRVDLVQYAQSQRKLLAVQIDAAINSGNSGGPVLRNGQLVGIAFQTLDDAASVGYVIASPVIQHFLADVESGRYEGFPNLGIRYQELESRALRQALGVSNDGRGVLVTQVAFESSAWGAIREGDVLLSLGNVSVSDAGTVTLRDGEIITFDYLIGRRQVGDQVDVELLREGELVSTSVTLRAPVHLVSEDPAGRKPSYFVFGGLLFVPVTRNYLATWGEQWWQHAPKELVALYEQGIPTESRQESVVLQKVLPDATNQGYHEIESLPIRTVQGIPVKNLRHLVALTESFEDEFVRFGAHDGRQIVLDRVQAVHRNSGILKRFGVPEDRSEDLTGAPALVVRKTAS